MIKIEYLIFHCSESDFGDVDLIKGWHVNERKWRDIGYNGVILNGKKASRDEIDQSQIGIFQEGRGLDLDMYVDSNERGAHVLNYNKKSMGICLIGKDKFEIKQFETALYLTRLFLRINPDIQIKGHYEMDTARGKTCPNFDMDNFRACIDDINHAPRQSIISLMADNIKS